MQTFLFKLIFQASDFSSPVRVASNNASGGGTSSYSEDAPAEGFICPMCMKGFLNPNDLQEHFESEHSNSPPSSLTGSFNGTGGGLSYLQGFIYSLTELHKQNSLCSEI